MKTDIVAALGVFTVPIVALIVFYLIRRLQSQERLLAIEKGANLPFEVVDPRERAARTRRTAIVLLATGLGFIIMIVVIAAVERDRDALAAAGVAAIPILIGLGLLYDYRARMRELQ